MAEERSERDERARRADIRQALEAMRGTPGFTRLVQGIRSRQAAALNAEPDLGLVLATLHLLGGTADGMVFATRAEELRARFGRPYEAFTQGSDTAQLRAALGLDEAALRDLLGMALQVLNRITEAAVLASVAGFRPPDPTTQEAAAAALGDRMDALTVRETAILLHARSDARPYVRDDRTAEVMRLLHPDAARRLLHRDKLAALLGLDARGFLAEASRLSLLWLQMITDIRREFRATPFGDEDDEH
ncbi:hypothetical protein [Falsiroseomonas stagni]|uniref:Uncharacterized protein n=1 Tax=Falsiroseomonas stagni DSM 19981 TaxID=1123062 RepID=A0A1I4F5Q8_9PROT|nr:hypothetical protein [Falsiroseomonas stagni]SFL13244.1 hypothetical protein SAMN02745775_12337 [Falsiroseomonas stagni DSM 19981]